MSWRPLAILATLIAFPAGAGAAEGLSVTWPEKEGWKVASRKETRQVLMLEVVRGDETLQNWTQIGTMIWNKGVVHPDLDKPYALYTGRLKAACPQVKFTTVLREPKVPFPRIIFTVECPKTPKDGHPESAVWLIVQGKQSLYVVHRATRRAPLPKKLRNEWVAWLKTATVVQE